MWDGVVRNGSAPSDRSPASATVLGPSAATARREAGAGGVAASSSSRYAATRLYGRWYVWSDTDSTIDRCPAPTPSTNRPPNSAVTSAAADAASCAGVSHTLRIDVPTTSRRLPPSSSRTRGRSPPGEPPSHIAPYGDSSSSAASSASSAAPDGSRLPPSHSPYGVREARNASRAEVRSLSDMRTSSRTGRLPPGRAPTRDDMSPASLR